MTYRSLTEAGQGFDSLHRLHPPPRLVLPIRCTEPTALPGQPVTLRSFLSFNRQQTPTRHSKETRPMNTQLTNPGTPNETPEDKIRTMGTVIQTTSMEAAEALQEVQRKLKTVRIPEGTTLHVSNSSLNLVLLEWENPENHLSVSMAIDLRDMLIDYKYTVRHRLDDQEPESPPSPLDSSTVEITGMDITGEQTWSWLRKQIEATDSA